MKHSIRIFILSFIASLALTSTSANERGGKLGNNQKEFIQHALEASKLEARAGKMAQVRAQHPAVKQLGEALVEDHQKIQDQLARLADKHRVKNEQEMKPEHQQELQRLGNATGEEFDRVFLEYIIRDHRRDLQMLQGKNFSDVDLRRFVQSNLPLLQRHLEMAEAARQNLRAARAETDGASITANLDFNPGDDSARQQRGRAANQREGNSFLGLPTSNEDGTLIGQLPAPSRTVRAGSDRAYIAEELADGKVDPQVESIRQADRDAVGAPPTLQREGRTSQSVRGEQEEVPEAVRRALKREGVRTEGNRVRPVTVYAVEANGDTLHVTEDGKVLQPRGKRSGRK